MNISKELWEKAVDQWIWVRDMTSYCTFEGVVNFFPPSSKTNQTDNFIDINFKDILVTFNKGKNGEAVLSDGFEIYNERGIFVGHYYINRPPQFVEDKSRTEKLVGNGEVDWGTEFGVYAINRYSRLWENTSYLTNTTIVIFNSEDPSFDESKVATDLTESLSDRYDCEDYDLYNGKHQFVGYAYHKIQH